MRDRLAVHSTIARRAGDGSVHGPGAVRRPGDPLIVFAEHPHDGGGVKGSGLHGVFTS